jgi:hypothetical protein
MSGRAVARLRVRSRLQLREGGDEQRVLLALARDFSLQPKAGAGNNDREAPDAVPHFPAEQDRIAWAQCSPVRC